MLFFHMTNNLSICFLRWYIFLLVGFRKGLTNLVYLLRGILAFIRQEFLILEAARKKSMKINNPDMYVE